MPSVIAATDLVPEGESAVQARWWWWGGQVEAAEPAPHQGEERLLEAAVRQPEGAAPLGLPVQHPQAQQEARGEHQEVQELQTRRKWVIQK